ncbi:hypothetical protein BROOK1789B_226 [Bathymodiolus brooksi thiotrophic gill symbiont]|nr:hypothetical protein BROOK1789B_226 [Bathymodiolus brooksi thiotrophic gill symbiont]
MLGLKSKYKSNKAYSKKKPRFHGDFFFVCFIETFAQIRIIIKN